MFTKAFWVNAAVRAFKTFAQTAIAVLGAGTLNVFQVDLLGVLGVSLGAALLSILTSVASVDTIAPPPPARTEPAGQGQQPPAPPAAT